MSAEKFIADRISRPDQNKGNISRPIVKIGIIGIATGISVMLLTVSIVLGFKKEIVNKITGLTAHASITNIQQNASNEPQPIKLAPDTFKLISALPFVKHIQTTAFKNGILKAENENEGILLKGVGRAYDFSYINKHLVEGSLFQFNDSAASRNMLISKALADKMKIKLNDRFLVYFISQHPVYDSLIKEEVTKTETFSRRMKICGIFKTDFSDFDNSLSLVDLRLIQQLNFWDSTLVGNYEIQLTDFERVTENVEEIQDLLGYDYNVNSVKVTYFNIFTWLDKLDINGVIIVVLMILVATINMITALLILILERANMVGLVKAFGMSNASVRKVFLFISLKLIGKGMLWGNMIGIALCLLQYYFKLARLDGATYYVDHVAIEINWFYFFVLNLMTFMICALMLILPTLILTKMTPIKTLKFD